jgi:hypothetical protein
VRLRQIYHLSQRISLARIDVEPGITKIFRICFDFPLIRMHATADQENQERSDREHGSQTAEERTKLL